MPQPRSADFTPLRMTAARTFSFCELAFLFSRNLGHFFIPQKAEHGSPAPCVRHRLGKTGVREKPEKPVSEKPVS
jgi:hypothetical protein